jgi:hypothetical protein
MRFKKSRGVRLSMERLESRDVPSTFVSQNFDTTTVGGLPAGWAQNSSNLSNFSDPTPFQVVSPTTPTPTSPANALAFDSIYSNTLGRAWSTAPVGPDAAAGVNVLMGIGPQARVIARGSGLDTATPTYYTATITGGTPSVGLIKVINGSETPVGTAVSSSVYLSGKWARVTLEAVGQTVRVKVQRLDSGADYGKYLNTAGQWAADVTGNTWAVTATDTSITAGTLTGIGRQNGSADPTYFDDFAASTPANATEESFETTAIGSQPSGWLNYSSQAANDPGGVFKVVSGTSYSPSNGYAVTTAAGSTVVRSWRNTQLSADQQASAMLLVNSATPAQVFVRGNALDTANPEYYALTADRASPSTGNGVHLQRYKRDGSGATVITDLATPLTMTPYTNGVWVRLTLKATGNRLQAEIYRPDTNQYVGPSGAWQTAQAYVFDVTDGGLTGGGYAGVGKYGGTGPITFDDFSTGQASPPPPPAPPSGPTVQFALSNYDVTEDSGAAQVRVVLNQKLSTELTVAYYTEAYTGSSPASAGMDYVPIQIGDGKVLTFLPGETEKSFTVPIYWDGISEPDEYVNLRLGTATSEQTVTVQSTPARLTIKDAPRSSVVVINQAWLSDPNNRAFASDPSGPYKLGLANTTYVLDTDVTKPGTAFVTTAKDVTLNLNWHTVTYGTGDYNNDGTSDLPALPNGGFDQGLPGDPTKPKDWDISGAPSAHLVPARAGMYGQMLEITDLSSDRTIISAPVTLPVANRQYAATITGFAPYGFARKVKIEVIDAATGAPLTTFSSPFGNAYPGEARADETGRGYSAVAAFNAPAGTTAVWLKVTITLDNSVPVEQRTTPLWFDLDYAGIFFSQDICVMAATVGNPTSDLPVQLQSIPGSQTAERFTLRNGNVVQGGAVGYFSIPLFFRGLNGATVDHVRSVVTGMDTHNLFLEGV